MKTITTLLYLLSFNLVFSNTDAEIGGFIDSVSSDTDKAFIKNYITHTNAICMTFNKSYLLISPEENNKIKYLSSELGIFEGKLNKNANNKLSMLVRRLKEIELEEKDIEIILSVRDGASFIFTNNKKSTYLSDPVILFLFQDNRYSKSLTEYVSIVIEILYYLSKFDRVAFNYFDLSLEKFNGNLEFDEFINQMKIERQKRKLEEKM